MYFVTTQKLRRLFENKNIIDYDTQNFIDSILDNIYKHKVLKNGNFGDLDSVSSWKHVSDFENAWRHYRIDRKALLRDTNYYIENKTLWCKELDWFYVNTLLFSELIATQTHYIQEMVPLTKFLWLQTTSRSFSWKLFLWITLCFIFKYGIQLFITLKLFEFSLFLGCIYLFLIIFGIMYRQLEKRKKVKQLCSMFLTYQNVSSINFSWRVLQDEMDNSRKKHNVIWDQEVYKLIDLRLENKLTN